MAYELIAEAPGDYRNARFLAKAADLAYYSEPEGPEKFREQLGLQAKLISVNNTQAYVAQDDQHVLAVFRGSESPGNLDGFKDWLLTNANNYLILPEGRIGTDFAAAGVGARFHKGFLTALADIWDPLYAELDRVLKEKERPLWVTGHSLGGAMALVAAWRFQQQFLQVHQVYTFGAPMIGNAAAAQAFEREFPNKIYRYVDEADLVPRLPTISLVANEYGHCLTEVVLTGTGGGVTGAALDVLKGIASTTVDGLLNATLVDDVWGVLKQRIGAHLMDNYQSRIDDRCKNPS